MYALKKHLNLKTIIALISTLGMIKWFMGEFHGGMFIRFISYPTFYSIILCLYIFSLIETFISLIRKGFRKNMIKVFLHSFVILSFAGIFSFQSEVFQSRKILSATLYDDLFNYTLILRENGDCETDINGMFGYHQTHKGNYYLKGDTIFFTKIPYDTNNFIPDTLLIDYSENAIFLNRNSNGNFDRKKEWLNYFEIHQSPL